MNPPPTTNPPTRELLATPISDFIGSFIQAYARGETRIGLVQCLAAHDGKRYVVEVELRVVDTQ